MNRIIFIVSTAVVTALLSGCYTQFMVDKTPPQPAQEQAEWVIDSTGDTVKVIKQVDTIRTQDHQTCIWERDLMGYPHLRCYNSYYPTDWFYYNNSPWWYRNDPYWYDYDRCPRSYYYDPSCGRCIYSSNYYYHGGRRHYGSDGIRYEKSEPAGPAGSSMSPRVRGIPNPQSDGTLSPNSRKATTSSTSTRATAGSENRTNGEIIIPSRSNDQPVITRERGRGVPQSGSSAPAPAAQKAPPPSKSANSGSSQTAPPPASANSPQSVAPSGSNSRQSPPPSSGSNSQDKSQRRRRPRSW